MSRGRAPRKPAAGDGELVGLVGGPLDGQWYWPADWAEARSVAQWSRDTYNRGPTEPGCRALGYRETDQWVAHPQPVQWPGGGRAWRWSVPSDQ